MSLDNSLKAGSKMKRPRNVLKRGERIEQLKADDKWIEGQTALGLPKVRVMKAVIGKKKKKTKDDK
ncbi:MAG: small basic protein [Planctomycetaceae bacterium]|nr:small basic protein [Planctomycetaceae bacterium]